MPIPLYRLVAISIFTASTLLIAQEAAPPKAAIPEFPASTTAAPAATPDPTAPTQANPLPATEETPVKPALKLLTKSEEKERRKKEKQAERDRKDAEADKTYLKLQGEDIVAPTLDADGNPIKLQPCSKKDKACIKKRKAILNRKKVGMKIENGTLTVDGWTGKARLNYDITEMKYLYVSTPGLGTVIISNQIFPGSVEEKNALSGSTLTVTTSDGHTIQIASEKPLVDKKSQSVWVASDPAYVYPAKYPTLGYGSIAHAPYNWPGARPMSEQQQKLAAKAPALPPGLEAKQIVLPCQKVLSGQHTIPVKINDVMMTPPACPMSASDAVPTPVQPAALVPSPK
ncbi:hypothetical protein [Terriglobus saanensis]|uniref:Uncharacterized protein n=1 Tax=Terriglobus saanensis (strain ATCC BAA-1853 / DSM 23119 / SP1PR4) TaxID=401053 RepID=E8V8H5_TERSS|nr:hypothetical protein [Terriglobus saanensis]ADV82954.1 hypothetical protein AciPR4_2152 [Terriglobus saanensis SP1PR4]